MLPSEFGSRPIFGGSGSDPLKIKRLRLLVNCKAEKYEFLTTTKNIFFPDTKSKSTKMNILIFSPLWSAPQAQSASKSSNSSKTRHFRRKNYFDDRPYQKYLLRPIQNVIFINACGALRPQAYVFLANFSEMADLSGKRHAYS